MLRHILLLILSIFGIGFLSTIVSQKTALIRNAQASENYLPVFQLLDDKENQVCHAYVNRLKSTTFVDGNPLNGRLIEPVLEGFTDLKSVPLSADEIYRIYYKIRSFYSYRNQDVIDRYRSAHGDSRFLFSGSKLLDEIRTTVADKDLMPFVRLQDPLDLDNDGKATDIVIQNDRSAFIVNPEMSRIDEAKMEMVFADRELLAWPLIKQFPPAAYPLHVFGFRKKFYFDGFLEMIFESRHDRILVRSDSVPLHLGVFINEQGQTRQVCKILWQNSKDLSNYRGVNRYFFMTTENGDIRAAPIRNVGMLCALTDCIGSK